MPDYDVVDEEFISRNKDIFEGLQRGTTFGRARTEDYVNLYILRTGTSLWAKPVLYFETGETVLLSYDTFVQIALPRSALTPDKPYTIVSRAGKALHKTVIWLKDDAPINNLVVDYRINEDTLFLLGLGLAGVGKIDMASWLVLPREDKKKQADAFLTSKRLADCRRDDCAERVQELLRQEFVEKKPSQPLTDRSSFQ